MVPRQFFEVLGYTLVESYDLASVAKLLTRIQRAPKTGLYLFMDPATLVTFRADADIQPRLSWCSIIPPSGPAVRQEFFESVPFSSQVSPWQFESVPVGIHLVAYL